MRANEALTFALRVLAGPAAFAAVRAVPLAGTGHALALPWSIPVAAIPDLTMNRNDTVVLGALSVTIVMFLLGVGFGLLLGC